jgi:hypothetical protein
MRCVPHSLLRQLKILSPGLVAENPGSFPEPDTLYPHRISYFFEIFLILSYHVRVYLSEVGQCLRIFGQKCCYPVYFSSLHVACSFYFVLIDFISLMYGEPV